LQNRPKFTKNWDFWLENNPSGNPGLRSLQKRQRPIDKRHCVKKRQQERPLLFAKLFY
jgi:hypothetical protein